MCKNVRVVLFLFFSMTLWGCGKEDMALSGTEVLTMTTSESELDITKADKSEITIENEELELSNKDNELPQFMYVGTDPYIRAICEFFIIRSAQKEPDFLYIPAPNILKIETVGEQIFVYGSIYDFWYTQEESILFCDSSSENTGRLSIELIDGMYQVTQFEEVGDGGDYVEDWKRLCGDDQELYESLFDRKPYEKKREEIRKELIAQYVEKNNLEIIGYQDYGWEPVMLFE